MKSLMHLYGRYGTRSLTLTSRFVGQLPADPLEMRSCKLIHRDGRAYLLVRLQHLWGEFCRELVVRSAVGGHATRTGQTLPRVPGVKCVRDIPNITNNPLSGPRTYWEDPTFAIDQARVLHVANYNEISLGLGSVSTDLANLKCARNVIVHPNANTYGKYIQMTRSIGFTRLSPDQFLHQHLPGGVTVFDTWVSVFLTAAWNAVA